MRILVTNDDGVHTPGLGALTRALAGWAAGAAEGEERQVIVVAPLANHSGASSAVGAVYEREAIEFQRVVIAGAEAVPAYGLDASPALAVIVGGLGGFGPAPDLVVSGINQGVNVGRSVLHSGTVGAVLTGAQLGLSGLAVSMRSGAERYHWDTAAALAISMLDALADAPAPLVLNLNVPSVPMASLAGVAPGHVGSAGIIKQAYPPDDRFPLAIGLLGATDALDAASARGEIHLRLGTAIPSLGELQADDRFGPDDDNTLLGAGYATVTPLVGVKEDLGTAASALVARSVAAAGGLLPS